MPRTNSSLEVRSLPSFLRGSRSDAITSAAPHTMLKGPHTRLERLIQTPIRTRQKIVSTISPTSDPMVNIHTTSAGPAPGSSAAGFSAVRG